MVIPEGDMNKKMPWDNRIIHRQAAAASAMPVPGWAAQIAPWDLKLAAGFIHIYKIQA